MSDEKDEPGAEEAADAEEAIESAAELFLQAHRTTGVLGLGAQQGVLAALLGIYDALEEEEGLSLEEARAMIVVAQAQAETIRGTGDLCPNCGRSWAEHRDHPEGEAAPPEPGSN